MTINDTPKPYKILSIKDSMRLDETGTPQAVDEVRFSWGNNNQGVIQVPKSVNDPSAIRNMILAHIEKFKGV